MVICTKGEFYLHLPATMFAAPDVEVTATEPALHG